MEEALKTIYERFCTIGFSYHIGISFHDDGKGCAVYVDGIFNCSYEWD